MTEVTSSQVLVIADDLTGANATGARFARAGLRAATVSRPELASSASDFDAVVISTDSRHLPADEAARKVGAVIDGFGPAALVVKRTDTTLRGNIGAETAAALDAVRRSRPGERVRGIMIPAFPTSGRVTVDGFQLLNGKPLEKTELRYDGQNPMLTSSVSEILTSQAPLTYRHVGLRAVVGDEEDLIAELLAGDEDVLICDALEDEHIQGLTAAAAEGSRRTGIRWVSIDPGPAGAMLAAALGLGQQTSAAPALLAIIGSVSELSQHQADYLARSELVETFEVSARHLAGEDDAALSHEAATIELGEQIAERLRAMRFPQQLVVRTPPNTDSTPLSQNGRLVLPGRLAASVRHAIGLTPIAGLYASGGDIASAILEECETLAFEILGEVVPLAVYGTVVGGDLDGLPVVTKGGMIGDEQTGEACMNQLRALGESRLSARRPASVTTTSSAQQQGD